MLERNREGHQQTHLKRQLLLLLIRTYARRLTILFASNKHIIFTHKSHNKMKLFDFIDDDTSRRMLAEFGRTPITILEDIDAIKEWFKKQPHLPEVPTDKMIENFLLMNKCSVELAKKKLDMFYSIRDLLPEFYVNVNPNNEQMKEVANLVYFVPLPKLTSDLNRVVVFKMITNDVEKFDPQALIAHALNVCIVRLLEDKAISNVLVCDLTGCHMGHLARLSPLFIKKVLYLVESVYTTRMEGMHYINCPPYVDKFLTLLKSIMKPKVAERVYVHKDLESLYKEVSKAVLPKDLGGDEKSLAELNDILKDKFDEHRQHFDHLEQLKVNEALRPGKPLNNELFGYSGNFKKLEVD